MANPEIKSIPKNTITKVATNVLTGQLKRLIPRASYLCTYRKTGEAAPTVETEFAKIFENSSSETISSYESIDIYIVCKSKAGSVRVDI